MQTLIGILLPLLGTSLGALGVLLLHRGPQGPAMKLLTGFAAGVMTAASIWSLLLPAIAQSGAMGAFAFVPAAAGYWAGVLLLMALGALCKRLPQDGLDGSTRLMMLAIVLHNLPEGMAVGVAFAGVLAGSPGMTVAGAFALSLGIAIQNIPEGAIISMPLHARGVKKSKALLWGVASGIVEPVGAGLTLLAARLSSQILPYLLSFAAGAMLHVVVQELTPELSEGDSNLGALSFAVGFSVMMALDVALG